ncbi:MFS transporter [Herbaspirillum sp. RV1423]|uniref:MFS transporter n=1 Tax=Herbaspirillum sp. RV1423 TaxID=1443993 RepID=UPI0004B442E6|nr:MFS transporter [Herbaspirillum sp. RV1423]
MTAASSPAAAPIAHAPQTIFSRRQLRRTVVTSLIGQVLEWYDFFLYGTAAALVFGKLFFPIGADPLLGTIAAFGGFAVGFVARPIGGILCGHIGDRYGRKSVLLITLLVMGLATLCMGLLPTYEQIGIAAPILLVGLRVLQGLAAGGEWSGSILMINESAPAHRRGFFSAFSPAGACLGFVLSSGAFLAVQSLPVDDFMRYGWRIPFLFSVILVIVGFYIRARVPESADFARISERKAQVKAPILQVLRNNPGQVLKVFGLRFGEGGASYLFFAFSLTYGKFIGLSNSLVLTGLTISMLLLIPSSLFFGHLSDRIGRKPVYIAGALGMTLIAFPFFWMLNSGATVWVMTALILANSVVLGALEGTQPAYMCELFDTRVRFSGLGLGRELSSVLGGGLSPVIAASLLAHYRSHTPVAIYLAGFGIVTLIFLCFIPETLHRGAVEADGKTGPHA